MSENHQCVNKEEGHEMKRPSDPSATSQSINLCPHHKYETGVVTDKRTRDNDIISRRFLSR